jgi:mono/diheme cytochrome c family protein
MKVSYAIPICILLLAGCDYMIDQPKQKTYTPKVAPASQPPDLVEFDRAPAAPPALTLALLRRGQERFRIYCTPCHSELGDGRGMIVQRGFPSPPDYTTPRLLNAPVRHFYDVMTDGYGAMYSFADRVEPSDRWAIAAYIRALQLARHATVDDVPAEQRSLLR